MLREIKSRWQHCFVDNRNRYQGECKEWYGDGKLLRHSCYLNDRLHGEYKDWWANGQLHINCFYINGLRHGEYKEWHSNGRYNQRCFHINGKLHGEYRQYFKSSGRLKSHYFYINDIKTSTKTLPYPETPEDRLYFTLKYDLPLLPAETSC